MNELTVYNNGANKVLMSANGKIARKPYQFRKAFANKAGLNNYIKITLPSLTQYGQLLKWTYYPPVGGNLGADIRYFNVKNSNNDNYNFALWEYGGGYFGYQKNSGNTSAANIFSIIGANPPTLMLSSLIIRAGNTGFLRYNMSIKTNNSISQTNAYPLTEILIGAARSANGSTISGYSPANMRHGEFVLFDRELTAAEYYHYYNNKNGNWLQSTIGYLGRWYCDYAEILDFSTLQNGSDMRVGCRDYSGFNYHGEIMLLPAGTLAEKAAWANANLFDNLIPS
jgi:hypothetical protein